MYDTPIVIVGNALTKPEWRRTNKNQTLVANFRVASTSRRFDRDNNRWVDGDTLRVRVNCWRRLAENVSASITVGDPVMVFGRLYTRDWVDGENNPRVSYEMEATAVGHDLARGRTKLFRTRPAGVTSAEGPETDGVVRGETADAVTDQPVTYGDGLPDDTTEPEFLEEKPDPVLDPVPGLLGGGGFEPFDKEVTPASPVPMPPSSPSSVSPSSVSPSSVSPSSPSDAEPEVEIAVEKVEEEPEQRRTRRSRRQPVGV